MKNHKKSIILFLGALMGSVVLALLILSYKKTSTAINIGILYAQKGPFAEQEQPIINAILFAINEINAQGGVNGHRVKPVLAQTELNIPEQFMHEAERMITHEKVHCLIGCRDFITRKQVKQVIEKYNSLLLYPTQWEGLEDSPNILYLGATPNQQIIPTITWACSNFGKKLIIVGADTIFTRIMHAIISYYIEALHGTILDTHFFTPHTTYDPIITAIKNNPPDTIINIVSEHNQSAFLKQLYQTGLTPQNIPLVSLVFSDNDTELVEEHLSGSYICKSYFQFLKSARNKKFIEAFTHRYPQHITTSMQTAYVGVHLWSQAVKEAKNDHYTALKPLLQTQTFNAPEGPVAIDPETGCCWHIIRINKIMNITDNNIIWDSNQPIAPIPYPPFNTKEQWHIFLKKLSKEWATL